MTWIKSNIVMLPTNEKAIEGDIGLNLTDNSLQIMQRKYLGGKFFETEDGSPVHGIVIPQHLYITSDEEIKEGNYAIVPMLDGSFTIALITEITKTGMAIFGNYAKVLDLGCNTSECKKIIAATDASLVLLNEQYFDVNKKKKSAILEQKNLPQLSQQFIEKYIEEYNKGNVIIEVLVEFEEYDHDEEWSDIGGAYETYKLRLKLDSQNQITIRKQKDNWNREDISKLVIKLKSLSKENQLKIINSVESFDKWIEENL